MTGISFDIKDFDTKIKKFDSKFHDATDKAILEVCLEIMRLSSFNVPHNKGLLQASASTETESGESLAVADQNGNVTAIAQQTREQSAVVGYNKVYAARLHEHPEYHFKQSGAHKRGAKYLEGPIKLNLSVFQSHIGETIKDSLSKL